MNTKSNKTGDDKNKTDSKTNSGFANMTGDSNKSSNNNKMGEVQLRDWRQKEDEPD